VLNNWKSQLLQPSARNDAGRRTQGNAESENQEDPQVLRLRRMLADLRGGDVHEERSELTAAGAIPADVAKAPEEQREAAESTTAPRTDTTLAAMLSLLAEQRELAEALLRECSTLEERVKVEATIVCADREFTEATQKADAAALLERRSKEVARAASERRNGLTTERLNLDELIAAARAERQTVDAAVSQAEQRLREARQVAEEWSARLDRDETRARECAANERAAAEEEREAAELVAAHQAAYLEAEKEVQSTKERVEDLKRSQASETQSFARIVEIEEIAIRIARRSAEY
jgi:hypothetical protein